MRIHTPKEKREEVWLTGYHFLGLVGLHVAVVLRSDWALGGFGTRIQTSIERVGVVGISHNWSWRNHLKQEQSCDDLHPGEGTQEIPFIQCNKLKIIFVCWGMNEGKDFLYNSAAKQKTHYIYSQTDVSFIFVFFTLLFVSTKKKKKSHNLVLKMNIFHPTFKKKKGNATIRKVPCKSVFVLTDCYKHPTKVAKYWLIVM